MKKGKYGLILGGLLLVGAAVADDDNERAREALARGEILPLTEILERVQADYPGQVMDTEFDRASRRYYYELTVLADNGYVLEIEVDAVSGRIVKVKREDD